MDDAKLQELIDACRPDGRDLGRPEFAELAARVSADDRVRRRFEAVGQFDRAVGEALHDVPVPAGLAQRLTAAASRAPTRDASARNTVPASAVELSSRRRRAAWKDAAELFATPAVLLLFAIGIFAVLPAASRTMSSEQLVERAEAWRQQLDHERWNEGLKAVPRDEFPLDANVAVSPWRWQRIETKSGDVLVYYGGPPDVMLFVTRSPLNVAGLGSSPKLLSATGGWSVGAWRQGDLTYVLVVEGDRRRYEGCFRIPAAA